MKRSFIIAKGDLRIITPVFGRGLCVSCPLDPPHLFRTVFLRIFYALELGVAFQYPVVLVYYNTDQYYSILAVMNGCGVDTGPRVTCIIGSMMVRLAMVNSG